MTPNSLQRNQASWFVDLCGRGPPYACAMCATRKASSSTCDTHVPACIPRTRVVGVDVIPALIDQARRAVGGDFVVTPYEAILPGSVQGRFDVAVCNVSRFGQEVVEAPFAAVPLLLRPGGCCVVQTLPPLVANGQSSYVDGWRDGSWAGFWGDFVDPPPWYFRTVESWLALFAAHEFGLRETLESMNTMTGTPASIIYVAGVVTGCDGGGWETHSRGRRVPAPLARSRWPGQDGPSSGLSR